MFYEEAKLVACVRETRGSKLC